MQRPPGQHALMPAVQPPDMANVPSQHFAPQHCAGKCRRTPCKFLTTPRGCKDGPECLYCHICVWKHSMRRRGRRLRADTDEDAGEGEGRPTRAEANAASGEIEDLLRGARIATRTASTPEMALPPLVPQYPSEYDPPPPLWWLASGSRPSAHAQELSILELVHAVAPSLSTPVPASVASESLPQAFVIVFNPLQPEPAPLTPDGKGCESGNASMADALILTAGAHTIPSSQSARRGLRNQKLYVRDR